MNAFLLLVFPSMMVAAFGAIAVWAHGKSLDRSARLRRGQRGVAAGD